MMRQADDNFLFKLLSNDYSDFDGDGLVILGNVRKCILVVVFIIALMYIFQVFNRLFSFSRHLLF